MCVVTVAKLATAPSVRTPSAASSAPELSRARLLVRHAHAFALRSLLPRASRRLATQPRLPWPPHEPPHRAPFSSPPPPKPTHETASRPLSEAHRPGHHLHTSPEHHRRGSVRRRPAARRGATTTDHLEPPNHHPQVRTSPLTLSPNFPLAAGAGPRRKRRRQALPCSQFCQGPTGRRNRSPGV